MKLVSSVMNHTKVIQKKFLLVLLLLFIPSCMWNKGYPSNGNRQPVLTPILTSDVASTKIPLLQETVDPKAAAHEEMRQGMQIGEEIIQSIENYHKTIGIYPNSLKELVPTYLDEIRQTTFKQELHYKLDPVDTYILEFKVVNLHNGSCAYIRRLESWDCGQAADP